jgi:UDP-N-acetylglucosamine 1-carboxyvinyltransferase
MGNDGALMSSLIVDGGKALSGTITPSGNKNAVLPILCATLLTDEPVVLRNVPSITDVETLVRFFECIGSKVDWDRAEGVLRIQNDDLVKSLEEVEVPQAIRSTVLLFAPLLHRIGRLEIASNTKGCALGIRELDPHLEALSRLGARVETGSAIVLSLPGAFTGSRHWLDYASVTTTENFVMAAAVAEGRSILINAASEPHVQDLCRFLNSMGAKISGMGTSVIEVEGVGRLSGAEASISSDHHEIATFLAIGAITGGTVRVEKSCPYQHQIIDRCFRKLGVEITYDDSTAIVEAGQRLKVEAPYTTNLLTKIEAAPWPYFPVDLLPPVVALAIRAEGVIHFWNKVYEGGFSWLPELVKFGAHAVTCDPHRIIVFGNCPLHPAVVEAPYIIRAAIALFMTAASIPGRSVVKNAESIRRAHPHFVENLASLGANVRWEEQDATALSPAAFSRLGG